MRHDGGFRWRRLVLLCLTANLAIAVSTVPTAAAYQASVYDNKTAFTTCAGLNTTIPQQLRALAVDAFKFMGYAPSSFEAATFTASRVLSRVPSDQGFYVHSHGDHYWIGWGFREDNGSCTQGIVTSSQIRSKRIDPATNQLRQANVVVASTCHLGESTSDFPDAFGVAKQRSTSTGANYQGPRFFLGYIGTAWTNDMLSFEAAFWKYVKSGRGLGEAFGLALRNAPLSGLTTPNWWGTYTYSGSPLPSQPCSRCL